MDDLISRQDAISALNEYFSRIGKLKRRGLTKGEEAISLDTVGVIKTLPSVQPEPHWIPVSERLPEESGWHICTCHDGVSERVTFLKWQKRLKQWEKTGTRSYWKVIAWMPLPVPYQRGCEEDVRKPD